MYVYPVQRVNTNPKTVNQNVKTAVKEHFLLQMENHVQIVRLGFTTIKWANLNVYHVALGGNQQQDKEYVKHVQKVSTKTTIHVKNVKTALFQILKELEVVGVYDAMV